MDVRRAAVTLLLLLAACGPGEVVLEDGPPDSESALDDEATSSSGLGGAVSYSENAWGVTFQNADGAWVIYKGCYGPRARGGRNLTVGPGYVARLTSRTTGKVLVEDETEAAAGWLYYGLSWPAAGGLGAFGWHHARANPPEQFKNQGADAWARADHNTWELNGRFCAEDHNGFGVTRAQLVDGPRIAAGGVGALTIDVFLSDAWTYPRALMRVRYRYRFFSSVVKVWVTATQLCPDGLCGAGAPGPAFLKEPKLRAAVRGGDFTRLAIFDGSGQVARNANGKECLYQGGDPTRSTGQCDADARARARFDFGDLASGADGRCEGPGRECLNVVMRAWPVLGTAADPAGAASSWEGSGTGFDAWAEAAAARPAVAPQDSGAGDKVGGWSCYLSPASQKNRRWESTGWEPVDGAYDEAGFGFHAWEGGTGAYDCEPLARRFGPQGESFAVHAQYSLGAGWSL